MYQPNPNVSIQRAIQLEKDIQQLLSPFDWEVRCHADILAGRIVVRIDKTINNPNSDLKGLAFGSIRHINEHEFAYGGNYIKYLPYDIARDVLLDSLKRVQDTYDKMVAGECDWRPNESIPENEYAR